MTLNGVCVRRHSVANMRDERARYGENICQGEVISDQKWERLPRRLRQYVASGGGNEIVKNLFFASAAST